MEATGVLKFRRYADGDVSDGETDGEDSFFELVFRSPDRVADDARVEDAAEKDLRFVRSPRGVLQSENGASTSKAASPVTLLRSTPKFKVFSFSFRKPTKGEKTQFAADSSSKIDGSDRLTVAAAGDNSLRSQLLREASEIEASPVKIPSTAKYLRLIKPLYQKVWKRQNEKVKSSDSLTQSSPPAPAKSESSRTGSFKIVSKRQRKSRSASLPPSGRRDDPQNDGIQGAVLYCKKSYNSSSSREISHLFRTSSDPWEEKMEKENQKSWCVAVTNLVGLLNIITLVLSIPITGGGIWLSLLANTECERFLDRSVISDSLAPRVHGRTHRRVSWLLWVYLQC
ncbi:Tetraspanin-8 [Striga hermonthica]|uniref:Tetraspanin-8 n=1 Tax=Striga hermonthica TaxID=68872 RepID=A0A9N7P2M3_STRHE|nr:Tetraspanin-8 [Striga hermonthica]